MRHVSIYAGVVCSAPLLFFTGSAPGFSVMSYRKGSKVWVEEKGEGWVEAEVVEVKDRAIVMLTSHRKKVRQSNPLLCLYGCLSLRRAVWDFSWVPYEFASSMIRDYRERRLFLLLV